MTDTKDVAYVRERLCVASDVFNEIFVKTKALSEENTKLKKQLAHVTRTQAKQFRDNQKLQVKAEHAKDVVNIDTARQIKRLNELLKECKHIMSIEKDFASCHFEKDKLCKLLTKINQALGE